MKHFNPMQVNNQYDEIDELLSIIDSAMKTLVQKTMKQRNLKYALNGYEQSLNDMKINLSKSNQSYHLKNIKRKELSKKFNRIHRLKKYIEKKKQEEERQLLELAEKLRRKIAIMKLKRNKHFRNYIAEKKEKYTKQKRDKAITANIIKRENHDKANRRLFDEE